MMTGLFDPARHEPLQASAPWTIPLRAGRSGASPTQPWPTTNPTCAGARTRSTNPCRRSSASTTRTPVPAAWSGRCGTWRGPGRSTHRPISASSSPPCATPTGLRWPTARTAAHRSCSATPGSTCCTGPFTPAKPCPGLATARHRAGQRLRNPVLFGDERINNGGDYQPFQSPTRPFKYALQFALFHVTSALPSSSGYCWFAHRKAERSASQSQLITATIVSSYLSPYR